MTQTLKQGPNGPIVELDPQLAGELGLRIGSPIEVRREGGRLVIEEAADQNGDPADAEHERLFLKAKEFAFAEYDDALRELSR